MCAAPWIVSGLRVSGQVPFFERLEPYAIQSSKRAFQDDLVRGLLVLLSDLALIDTFEQDFPAQSHQQSQQQHILLYPARDALMPQSVTDCPYPTSRLAGGVMGHASRIAIRVESCLREFFPLVAQSVELGARPAPVMPLSIVIFL
ncbi:hypothetical protein BCR44DRAFT_1439878 [Catenaria anguillulae PL171]|uniref:Uncharacterized protein n=1 Tax=Catenaria anguillulae PL171 TaxID=765915 RepID=A0A1Y2HDE2_9FUNG|nr:hypothetical protein BCR44DRAFT_1439878 [Catenaria anguillulae PL171]